MGIVGAIGDTLASCRLRPEAEEAARVGAEAEAEETRLRFDDARNKRGAIDNEFYSVLPILRVESF